MGVIKYETKQKASIYAKQIQELIDAGEGAAYELDIPVEPVYGVPGGGYKSQKAAIQAAARDADRSARFVDERDAKAKGYVTVTFILNPRRTRTVKGKPSAE